MQPDLINKGGVRVFLTPNCLHVNMRLVSRALQKQTLDHVPRFLPKIFSCGMVLTLNSNSQLLVYLYRENQTLLFGNPKQCKLSNRFLNTKFLQPWRIKLLPFHRLLLCFLIVEMYPSIMTTWLEESTFFFEPSTDGAWSLHPSGRFRHLELHLEEFSSFRNWHKPYDECVDI